MIHYLNNCQNYDHPKAYGSENSDAFFDLYTSGRDKKHLQSFHIGDECVVATKVNRISGKNGQGPDSVVLSRYRLARTFTGKYRESVETLVLCGPLISRAAMPKADAAASPQYSRFFSKVGHFKQLSVLGDA